MKTVALRGGGHLTFLENDELFKTIFNSFVNLADESYEIAEILPEKDINNDQNIAQKSLLVLLYMYLN